MDLGKSVRCEYMFICLYLVGSTIYNTSFIGNKQNYTNKK